MAIVTYRNDARRMFVGVKQLNVIKDDFFYHITKVYKIGKHLLIWQTLINHDRNQLPIKVVFKADASIGIHHLGLIRLWS